MQQVKNRIPLQFRGDVIEMHAEMNMHFTAMMHYDALLYLSGKVCTDLDYADDVSFASQHVGNTSSCSRNTARGVFTNWTRNQLE